MFAVTLLLYEIYAPCGHTERILKVMGDNAGELIEAPIPSFEFSFSLFSLGNITQNPD
jgi:hypothetical protein